MAAGLSASTALTYYNSMCFLLKDQHLIDCRNIDIPAALEKLGSMKYKNQYSKYKNAFSKFCDFLHISLNTDIKEKLEAMKGEKKKKYRKLKPVKLLDIKNQLRVIRDTKLKTSYEMMLHTGIRVSELCQIKKEDCQIQNKSLLEFSFVGKGGKKEKVFVSKERDKKLFQRILDLIEKTKTGNRVFYSPNYLQAKAKERGFNCHDLRRAFAKLTFKDYKDINATRILLRHSKLKNTKIYLRSKIEI